MIWIFYIASLVAFVATINVVLQKNAVHALLYLIVSLLGISVIYFVVGAPFAAALEVIVYAGAIMVLFVFAIMMLNLGKDSVPAEKAILNKRAWIGPIILTLILFGEFIYIMVNSITTNRSVSVVGPHEVSHSLFGAYVLGIELTAMLLMAAIVGAYHIGKEKKKEYHRYLQNQEEL